MSGDLLWFSPHENRSPDGEDDGTVVCEQHDFEGGIRIPAVLALLQRGAPSFVTRANRVHGSPLRERVVDLATATVIAALCALSGNYSAT